MRSWHNRGVDPGLNFAEIDDHFPINRFLEVLMTKAVLFDCDGVLVDSEALSKGLMVQMMRDLGVERDPRSVLHEFSGKRMSDCLDNVAEWLGTPLPDDFVTNFRRREYALLKEEVSAIPGIESVLTELRERSIDFAVASNGPLEKIKTTLSATGLYHLFGEHIYSAYEDNLFKPEPGLYLHAAAKLETDPRDCVVVEDSIVGARAGIAAGMRVLGYVPDAPHDAMREIGAEPFVDMAALPSLLSS